MRAVEATIMQAEIELLKEQRDEALADRDHWRRLAQNLGARMRELGAVAIVTAELSRAEVG